MLISVNSHKQARRTPTNGNTFGRKRHTTPKQPQATPQWLTAFKTFQNETFLFEQTTTINNNSELCAC